MHRQQGQALPLGIALIMFCALMGIVLFNTGQLASEKTRLANTADAAAYSGLIWQARTLNFEAYTNRAMVANQVAIGQIVSLVSWTEYGKITARNLDSTIGWIPFLKPYTAAFRKAMNTVESVMQKVGRVAINVLDMVIGALSEVQEVAYNAAYLATPEVVKAVVERNDKRYKVLSTAYSVGSLLANASAWEKLAKQYSDDDMLMRKADVIMKSRDRFTRDRGWGLSDIGIGLPNTVYITWFLKVSMYKEGETRLIKEKKDSSSSGGGILGGGAAAKSKWTWKGKDTLSLHVKTWGCDGWASCGWDHQEVPIGWGEAYIKQDVEYCEDKGSGGFFSWFLSSSGCPRWMKHNRLGERLADREKEEIDADYDGVRAYYDLKDLSAKNKDPRLVLSIEVEATGGDVRTASKVDGVGSSSASDKTLANGMGEGVFRVDDQLASESLVSISTAEVYFKRPEKLFVDGKERTEYANLFNPYWQVRLTETSKARRYAAWAIRASDLATKL